MEPQLHKRCIYGGDRLVTKSNYVKKIVISGCILPSIAGASWQFISVTLHPFAENVYFISIGQYLRPNFWQRTATSFVYLGFCWMDISENSRFSLHTFPLKQAQVLLLSVSNYQHFTCTAMYLLVRFSASSKCIFLKTHTCRPTYITYMRYILVMFELQLRALDQHNNVSYQLYQCFQWRDFLENLCLEPTNI